jgi:8-oxo-dGTP pyrophosphatase MutT (NUDIX family)
MTATLVSGDARMKSNANVAGAHVVIYRQLKASRGLAREESVRAVVLCKRTQNAPIHPGYWALFGGQLKNSEEPPKDAAIREVEEELGLTLDATQLEKLGFPVSIARAGGAVSI